MPESKKPEGWRAFDALAKAVVKVPKAEVDARVARDKAARMKKRRSRKK